MLLLAVDQRIPRPGRNLLASSVPFYCHFVRLLPFCAAAVNVALNLPLIMPL